MNRDIATSVAKNTTIQFGQQLVTWASSFVLMLFLPRYLGPERYGRLYLAEMVAMIFIIVVAYDGRIGIAKQVSRNREEAGEILVNSLGFRVLFWFGSLTGMVAFSLIAGYPPPVVIMIAIFGLEMLWVAGRAVYAGVFLGFENTTYTAVSAIAERVFVSAFGITALLMGADEVGIAVIMAVGTLINFLICAVLLKRLVPALPRFSWPRARKLIKDGFPFLMWTIFGVVYYRIDTVMLSLMSPEKVVGWYGAAYKFYDVLVFLPSIFSIAVLPVMAKLYGKENMLLARTSQKGMNFIFLTGVPISIGCYLFSTEIIGFLFGLESYTPSILNLKLFSAGLLLLYIDMVLASAIIAVDKENKLALVAAVAVVVNVVLNYFMIPYTQTHLNNGGAGAAIATMVTEFFVLVCSLLILPKEIFAGFRKDVLIKSLLGSGAMGCFIVLLRNVFPSIQWILLALGAGVFYAGVLLLMKTFSAKEIEFIRQFTNPRNLRNVLSGRKEGDS